MERTPVASSNLKSVGYDPATQTLEVEFHSGAVHSYQGVPEHLHRGLLDAPSAGKFFHANIRNAFPSRKEGSENGAPDSRKTK